ncbi:phosphoinositide 3-kinase regulatory subunit 4 [Lasius niger]|uniref:non-specific serine/threonine protein kinase n=1 Tax=Lasius niger TaxID=67767 RepID=A0A0J7L8Y7_LASNI|nr:phosphoinositide 3-kinase regulatory subunit 4 [Lasius niger]
MREYVKYSLYDRISTRPFLTSIEKKWITFQVLYALHQAHKFGVCHGDIKLENIMITSWNWVLLTDFASFKPTYLPEDNPADFSYFFDTSRRRTCYIAPERFVKTLSSELSNTLLLPEQEVKTGDLHPMMDIFSAGCALTELYNEGHPPFDFSQLLAYRNNEYSVNKHLDSIEDPGIRELLGSMLERNPVNRKSAEIYLAQARGIIFPEYFYSFLQSYMLIFSAAPILSPDEKITRLKKDIGNIISILRAEENERTRMSGMKSAETKSGQCESNMESIKDDSGHSEENTIVEVDSDQSSDKTDLTQLDMKSTTQDVGTEIQVEVESELKTSVDKQTCDEESQKPVLASTDILEGLVIVTQLVTSCIRGLHHSQSKLYSLEILLELAENVSDETILDRILPYIFHLVHDPAPRVRVSAIHTLTKCLHLVKLIPPSDVNIFPEYILPGLAHITQDEAVIVRAAYAENIAHLAHIALRYLENAHLSNLNNKEGPKPSYDSELQTLHEMVQQSVSMLLTDPQNLVKQTLMESGINKLCVFFGKQKANDILLSHVITFLNDKEDKELRGSFFECIVGVAAYVGWHSSPILMPLLQQGLSDPEEFVTTKAINAMATLTELGLLHKSALYQLLSETMVFLIEKEILLLEALVPPISRIVYDSVVKYNDVEELFQVLEQRQAARAKAVMGVVPPQYNDMSTSLRNLFRRLSSESMTEAVENQLLIMKPHLMKINKYRSADTKQNAVKPADGKLELSPVKDRIRHHVVVLYPDTKGDLTLPPFKRSDRRTSETVGTYATMNQEWRTMFAAQDNAQEEGCAVDLQYLDCGSQSVLVYASLYGSLVGWDLRCPGTTWRLENDLKHGVITSFCVNSHQQWLTLGTSSGIHTCWDLRFQLPITSIKHPTGARVRKVITHPTEHSWIISAVQGNNEISMWNLETDHRQMVLWASSAPPLSRTQTGHSVCAMYTGCIDCSGFLLAGGTDMRLRFWDFNRPTASYVALPAANDVLTPNSLAYDLRLIDGTNVVQEVLVDDDSNPSSGSDARGRNIEESGPETPPSGQHDTISAVAMSNMCILTGSTDGLIQVWK